MIKFVKIDDNLINIDNIERIYEEEHCFTIIDLVSGKSVLVYGDMYEIEKIIKGAERRRASNGNL